jgi:predicted nucleic acid-binding protein
MTNIVVDTNILFSALLNTNSRIGQILISGSDYFKFYAPTYIRNEIWDHHIKIKKLGNLSDEQFQEVYELTFNNITILNHSIVPVDMYRQAYELCCDIDPDDTPFVAFSLFLNSKLWTGDKKLITGLSKKGFKNSITTEALFQEFIINLQKP